MEVVQRPAAALSTFGRFHVFQTAVALNELGVLDRLYIADRARCPVAIRHVVSRPPVPVHLACWALAKLGASRAERACWEFFDRWVANRVSSRPDPPSIFHGFSLYSLASIRATKRRGMTTIVERAGSHILHQLEIVASERERWGASNSIDSPSAYEQASARMIEEYANADFILASSEYARQTFIKRGIAPERVKSIHLGANFKPSEVPRDPRSPFRLLCIGGGFYLKGIMYLVKAWEMLRLPNAELALLTFPPGHVRLDQYAAVTLLRPMNQSALTAEYQRASAFCLPSVDDGFGLVVLEAMAYGLPVIVSEAAGASEIVRHGIDGYVCPPRDSESLATAILNLYSQRDRALTMGAAARDRAVQFSWQNYGRRLTDWYSSLVVN